MSRHKIGATADLNTVVSQWSVRGQENRIRRTAKHRAGSAIPETHHFNRKPGEVGFNVQPLAG